MAKKLQMIDLKTMKVVNQTIAWEPPAGMIAVENEEAMVGWNYDSETGKFFPDAEEKPE